MYSKKERVEIELNQKIHDHYCNEAYYCIDIVNGKRGLYNVTKRYYDGWSEVVMRKIPLKTIIEAFGLCV